MYKQQKAIKAGKITNLLELELFDVKSDKRNRNKREVKH